MKPEHAHIQNSPIGYFKKYLIGEFSVIILGGVLYFLLITIIDHAKYQGYMPTFIIIFALFKVLYFLNNTFRRAPLENIASFYQLIYSFGTIIFIIILSFALDYTCLSDCKPDSFNGINNNLSIFHTFFEFVYFSIVTFATIGYGDIHPATLSSKFLVVLEISFSFIMVVFAMSNFKRLK